MRITQRMMTDNAIKYMDENFQRLYQLQEKVASGKEFQRPSDNPSGMAAAFSLRSSLTATQAYIDTAETTDSWMTTTDFSLNQMIQLATRAVNLARDGVSDTMGAQQRSAMAAEVDVIIQQVLNIANSSHQNNYIFGGFQTQTPPFALSDTNSDGRTDTVTYNGDNGQINQLISPGLTITKNINDPQAFSDLMQVIMSARDALLSNDTTQVQAVIAPLESSIQEITELMTTNGARQRQVRLAKDRLEKAQIELRSLLSTKEDANMTEAISYLQHQQTVYQMVLEVGQRAISAMSLFDLLS